ncbi:MAG: PHP domain-containing protein [Candidatus Aminicenantes bacterium]|jgi:predicted metal-dependent phosphoesterase TrpH|nr:PHP domain-containing protein [Candidatus Aminicenantes bacterium]
MLRTYRADLHVHTCLSPCGDLEMSPHKIANQAKIKELDILGICDHNSAENTPALMKAAEKFDIRVLPGMEVTSQEEVHILALFDKVEPALALQDIIYAHLPGENDERAFGMQVIVNHRGDVLGFNKRLLIGASTLTLEEVVATIHSLNGLAVASHIDREGFSLIGQLGFIPDHLELDALEISPRMSFSEAQAKFAPHLPVISSSDAHFLNEIGIGTTTFLLQAGTLDEIKMAFLDTGGRKIIH